MPDITAASSQLSIEDLIKAAGMATPNQQFYVRTAGGRMLTIEKIVLERERGRTSKLDLVIEVR